MSSPFLTGGRTTPVAEVVSTLGGLVLGEVPITQGHFTEQASGSSLGRLEITVPAVGWVPTSPRDPLAAYGQELTVRRGFRLPSGETVGWETLTRARIQSSEPDDAWLTVVAESIDARLNPADWIVSYRSTGNVHSQVRQICSGVVPVRLECDDVELPDRTWEQQSSRRDALLEVCDAAGAVPRIINGQLVVVDASTSTTPEFELRSGDGGTVVRVLPEQSTELVPNVVVASSAPEDNTAPVSAMAVIDYGPMNWRGPYGQVVEFFTSPLLTTQSACEGAARTRLARKQAVRRDLTVEMVTDPRIRLDAVVRVIEEKRDTDCVMRVTSGRHALTAGREPGSLSGVVLSGVVRGQRW